MGTYINNLILNEKKNISWFISKFLSTAPLYIYVFVYKKKSNNDNNNKNSFVRTGGGAASAQ